MADQRLKVVVTRRLPEEVEKRLCDLFDTTLREDDTPMTKMELIEAVKTADVLVPTVTDQIDAGVIAHAGPQMKLFASYGAGVDHIDVSTARQRGILVSYTPNVVTEDTADMTMGLILAVTRRIPEGLSIMNSGKWAGWAPTALLGGRVNGRRLGILGMGKVGQAVARRALAFGMEIHYHDLRRAHEAVETEISARFWEDLDEMVRRVDILSVNCPSTPETFHLMNARRLKLMKPSAVIVNTARGDVIDEKAMTRMLRAGELAGAGLDVFERGAEITPELRDLSNVVLLPHMASATHEGRVEMGEKVIINIKTFADGHRPPDQVIPGMV
ncbi:MAG: 2-hydroxyacid dehydrogenase [Mangrovicoccus sp.]